MSADIKRQWTQEEEEKLDQLLRLEASHHVIARELNLRIDQVRWHLRSRAKRISESPYPKHVDPLRMTGDALILPDIELPFHNADFLNNVLDLASRWNIRQCIVAGDLLHLASISAWGPNWLEPANGISADVETALMGFATKLSSKKQDELFTILGKFQENEDHNFSTELGIVRKEVATLSEAFEEIHLVLGNHEDRLMRALDVPMSPNEILVTIRAGDKWKTSAYYYSILETESGEFQIEHPKSAAKTAATKLATIHQRSILMAHSHRWCLEKDPSGRYWAIQMGCVVDESRLPYASQRHNLADMHRLGAVIVRDGYPYLLGEETPFHRM